VAYTLSRYKTASWADTERELGWCFDKWGVTSWSAEPNVPRARVNNVTFAPGETAVTVRYMQAGHEVVLSMDTQAWPAGNLRALYLCIEAMRMLEVRGMADTVRSAYKQLEAPAAARDPWEVFGLRPGASRDQIEGMFRILAKTAHPDQGGSDAAMAELNAAHNALLSRL
jgi:hypothetical protein